MALEWGLVARGTDDVIRALELSSLSPGHPERREGLESEFSDLILRSETSIKASKWRDLESFQVVERVRVL